MIEYDGDTRQVSLTHLSPRGLVVMGGKVHRIVRVDHGSAGWDTVVTREGESFIYPSHGSAPVPVAWDLTPEHMAAL